MHPWAGKIREVAKKRIFYGQADAKGGGLTVRKCENFDPFFPIKFDSLILKNTFYLIVKGLKNAFFMPFRGSLSEGQSLTHPEGP